MKEEVIAALLSWAIKLSGYPEPDHLPQIEYKTHEWLKEHACKNGPCDVLGWYPDAGVIYIDAKFELDDSSWVSSLIVHEMVHFLQNDSGKFDKFNCADVIKREREAYRVQNDYLVAIGNPALVFNHPSCVVY